MTENYFIANIIIDEKATPEIINQTIDSINEPNFKTIEISEGNLKDESSLQATVKSRTYKRPTKESFRSDNLAKEFNPAIYKPCQQCSLCSRFVYADMIQNGHQVISEVSNKPLSKVLVYSVQISLRLPSKNWDICTLCVDKLKNADKKLKELTRVQTEMSYIKKDLLTMIKKKLPTMRAHMNKEKHGSSLLYKEISRYDITPEAEPKLIGCHNSPLTGTLTTEEGREKINCPLCLKEMTKRYLRIHVPRIHTKTIPIMCIKCERKIPSEQDFINHLYSSHPKDSVENISYNCELEKAVTKKFGSLPMHKHKVKCPICDVTMLRSYLKRHINIHEQKKIYKCRRCSEMFSEYYKRMAHMKKVHGLPELDKNILKCQYCQKNYPGKNRLMQHIKLVHTSTKKYKCEFCEKAFKVKQQLILHRRKHTDERPYGCKLCNQFFRRSIGCRKHIQRVHKIDLKNIRMKDPLIPMIKVNTKPVPHLIATKISHPIDSVSAKILETSTMVIKTAKVAVSKLTP